MTFESDYTTGGRETVRDLLVDAERRLTNVGVPSPNVDAAEIIAYALGTTRGRMILQDPVNSEQRVAIEQMLTRRLTRVPLQHLVGSTGFRHLDISVGPGVFIPRPETELVAEAAIRELAEQPVASRIAVDLCTGSGAIAIALGTEVDHSRVYAVELDGEAIPDAEQNVQRNGVADRVHVFEADAGALLPLLAPVRVVLANIISSVLVELLPIIAASLTTDGGAILSGILQEERADMLAVLAATGWRVLDDDAEDIWWSVSIARA